MRKVTQEIHFRGFSQLTTMKMFAWMAVRIVIVTIAVQEKYEKYRIDRTDLKEQMIRKKP